MRQFRLTLAFAIAALLAQTQASRADCALLLALQNWTLTAQQKADLETAKKSGDKARVQACSEADLAAWLGAQAKGDRAQNPITPGAIAGVWVNEFWATVGNGLVIPNIETLAIAADGALERRVLRFADPATLDSNNTNAEPKTPDLNPLLAKGVLAKQADGRFAMRGLVENEVELESGKRLDAALYAQRVKVVRFAMPDLSKPFRILAAGDRMAIRDTNGHIRTYRRYDESDVKRAHAIILGGEISGGMFWPCVLGKFGADNPQRAELRRAGDAALTALAIRAQMEALMAALRKPGQPDGSSRADLQKQAAGLFAKMEAHRQTPPMAFLQKSAGPERPFGCVRPLQ